MVCKCFRLGIKKQIYSLCLAMRFLSYSTAIIWSGDAAVAYQLGFQDPATTTMEGIYVFNLHLLLVIISIGVKCCV